MWGAACEVCVDMCRGACVCERVACVYAYRNGCAWMLCQVRMYMYVCIRCICTYIYVRVCVSLVRMCIYVCVRCVCVYTYVGGCYVCDCMCEGMHNVHCVLF